MYAAKKYQVMMKEAPGSSETSVLTRATRRNNPEDTILHCLWNSVMWEERNIYRLLQEGENYDIYDVYDVDETIFLSETYQNLHFLGGFAKMI
jgi:hypothetical protein